MTRVPALFASLALAGLLAACSTGGAGDDSGGRVKVVASTGIFADFAREVGGERVDVTSLLPPNSEPHTYEPGPADVRRIAEADVVFLNGLGLEGNLQDTIRSVAGSGRVVYLSGYPDPAKVVLDDIHLWLDVNQAIQYVQRLRDGLIKADPAGDTYYRANTDGYSGRLRELDGEIQAAVDSIPPERRRLVTFHNAFKTFAERYGLRVAGFVVSSPGGDPSPKDIADLVRVVEDEGVKAAFVERGFNAKALEEVAGDAGVRVCSLYSDALSDAAPTYIDMMRANARELARCLGG